MTNNKGRLTMIFGTKSTNSKLKFNSAAIQQHQISHQETGRVAQWSMRPVWYPKGPGFEPGLFHDACYMPSSLGWMKLKLPYRNKRYNSLEIDWNTHEFGAGLAPADHVSVDLDLSNFIGTDRGTEMRRNSLWRLRRLKGLDIQRFSEETRLKYDKNRTI